MTEASPGVMAVRLYTLSSRNAGMMTTESLGAPPVSTTTQTEPFSDLKYERLPRMIAACRATPTVREKRLEALESSALARARLNDGRAIAERIPMTAMTM